MTPEYRSKEAITKELTIMREIMEEIDLCNGELQKYKEKLTKLLDSSPDALVFVNPASRIIMANSQFEHMFGYAHNEIKDKGLDILIPERFREKHKELVSDFLKNPTPRPMGSNLEIYGLKKNGEEFPADISLSLLKTEDEYYISAAIRDITRRKEAEKQMELDYFLQKALNAMLEISLEPLPQEKQFQKILKLILAMPHLTLQSMGAIYTADEESKVLTLKAAHGFEDSEFSLCREIPFGECLCGIAASRAEIVHSDQYNERHTLNKINNIPHGHYCIPIVSAGKSIGLLNIYLKEGHKKNRKEEQFLTSVANTLALTINHHNIEREKEQLQIKLADSEKLTALGRFTANVAHEIRNPLTAIGGLARRLKKRMTEGTKESDYAGFIASEVSVLEKILSKVLTYSRESSQDREHMSIHGIIESLLKLNEDNILEKRIAIKKSYGLSQDLLLDKTEMHEAIENILVNAIDSMQPEGELTITTGTEIVQGSLLAYVKFRDTGAGITDEQLKTIFEPFYTTKISDKGTGLGLPITKKIVENHGGFITVESEVDKGSTFTLYFPLEENQPA